MSIDFVLCNHALSMGQWALSKGSTDKQTRLKNIQSPATLTENSPVRSASLNKAEIFYGYFDIFGHPK